MKRMNQKEIEDLVSRLRSLIGARLNKVHCSAPLVIFEFFHQQKIYFMVIDLTPHLPMAILFVDKLPIKISNKHKPLTLFIKAHFDGKILSNVEYEPAWGRIFKLSFQHNSQQIEFRLFPHGQNVIAATDDKKVSWTKPKELNEQILTPNEEYEVRSSQVLRDLWLENRNTKKTKNTQEPEKLLKDERKKRQKALAKIKNEMEQQAQKQQLWAQMANALSENLNSYNLQVPWQGLYDESLSAPLNMQKAFSQVKLSNKKLNGLNERFNKLAAEIENLSLDKIKKKTQLKKTAPQVSVKGKSWTLDSGLRVVVGRNAKENTDLLRKAKAWDLWMHLKDFPGAYGIIFRQKKQAVNDKELREVAAWVAKMSLKNKWEQFKGQKLIILVAECRFVQPIKGDKLGRVTYKNEKTFIISNS
ncbi:MAG: hypothetical protein KDD40_01190 [Bdellovibrionales bacterium]|nr:hypothetical protein [Bdellovibrionales bacterium]